MATEDIPPPLPLTATNHVSLACASAEVSLDWYRDLFGFELTPRPNLSVDGYWLVHNVAGFQYHIIQNPQTGRSTDISEHRDHVCLAVTSLDAAEAVLSACDNPPPFARDPDGGPRLTLLDPDYNVIVLLEVGGVDWASGTEAEAGKIPLVGLVWRGYLVTDMASTIKFYTEVLGFVALKEASDDDVGCDNPMAAAVRAHMSRVAAGDCGGGGTGTIAGTVVLGHPGAGLFLKLIPMPEEAPDGVRLLPEDRGVIFGADDHISFYLSDVDAAEALLGEGNWTFRHSELPGADVDQTFFKDLDGHMLELCTCEDCIEEFQPSPTYTAAYKAAGQRMCAAVDALRA